MNKKLKYLALIPLYGTCGLLIYLFILSIKDKISKKHFFRIFIICSIFSAICWYIIALIVYIIGEQILGIFIIMIIGGYMMNICTFKYIDKNWDYLSSVCKNK